MERPLRPVERRSAHDVPASPAEEQPVRAQPRDDLLLFLKAVVADAHVAAADDRVEQLLVDRLAAFQRIDRAALDADRRHDVAKLLAQPGGKAAFELDGRAAGRTEKRKTGAVAQLVAQHDQRQRLFRREVGRRQQAGPGDAIVLLPLVERQRNARLAKQVQIAEDRAPAYAAFQGQRLSVVPPSNLKQTDQLQQTVDSRQVHGYCPFPRRSSRQAAPVGRPFPPPPSRWRQVSIRRAFASAGGDACGLSAGSGTSSGSLCIGRGTWPAAGRFRQRRLGGNRVRRNRLGRNSAPARASPAPVSAPCLLAFLRSIAALQPHTVRVLLDRPAADDLRLREAVVEVLEAARARERRRASKYALPGHGPSAK